MVFKKKHHEASRETGDELLKPQDIKVLSSLNRIWKTMVAIGSILGALYAFENWNYRRLADKEAQDRPKISRQEFEKRMGDVRQQIKDLDTTLDEEVKERLKDKAELEQHINRK